MKRLRPTSVLLMLLAIDFIWQLISLYLSVGENPTLLALSGDSLEYWHMSDSILDGNLVQKQPFLSAPLYPYFIALLRALGLEIVGVMVVQIMLRSATAWLITACSKKLFDNAWLSFTSAASFLLLLEPAYFATRMVNSSLQLLLVAGVVFTFLRFRESQSARRAVGYGGTVGLAILAHPPLLASIPFLAWQALRKSKQRQIGLLVVFSMVLVTATATVHNAQATKGSPGGVEFIPVSAQAGVTFAHGNALGSNGTYQPLEGVSANRLRQNSDAYEIVKQQTGEEGWQHTSDFYMQQGLDYWANNPGTAVSLFFTKLRWLFAGNNYGDLFFINLERSDNAWPRPATPLNFIKVGWLLPLSLVGLIMLWRRRNTARLPLTLLFLSAAAVVVVFWYSPRYRLPLVPIAAIVAPWAIYSIGRSRNLVTAMLIAIPILIIEGSSAMDDFDPIDKPMAGSFNLNTGLNYMELEQYELAIPRFEHAIANGQNKAVTHIALAESQVKIGTSFGQQGDISAADLMFNAAIENYYTALELNPSKDDARQSLVSVLEFMKRNPEANKVKDEGKRIKSQ